MLDWRGISTVLLDMDGTLLDLHFDNQFWREHVPLRYGELRGITHAVAREELKSRYVAHAGTLAWYSVEFWQAELGLDIMALKRELAHLVAVHPEVIGFLDAVRADGRRVLLVTNAHRLSMDFKLELTGLADRFDALVSSHDLGLPKEAPQFWRRLQELVGFDAATTLLVDDSLPVLDSAREFGIAHLLSVSKPDSRAPAQRTGAYRAIASFRDLTESLK